MSTFNRVAVAIFALIILAAAVITVLVTAGITEPGDYGWLDRALQEADDASGASAAGIILVCIVIALGTIALLLIELVPSHKRVLLLISSTDDGRTTVDRESIRVLAERTGVAIYDVREVNCDVRETAGGLVITCQTTLAMGCSIPEISSDLQSKVREAVEGFTGLLIAQVNVKAEYERDHKKALTLR